MEQILYIGLGALLAIFGGVVTQRIQNYYNQRKEEEQLLKKAIDKLQDLNYYSDPTVHKYELFMIAIRIHSKCYLGLAKELIEITEIKDPNEMKKTIIPLMNKIAEEINKPLFRKLEKNKTNQNDKKKEKE